MTKRTIYTLDARGNVMLEVIRDYLELKPDRMYREIQKMHAHMVEVLAEKNVKYSSLKTALIPSTKRREIALFFDTLSIGDSWYGNEIHSRLLPLFSKESNHCVLGGDYIGENEHQPQLHEAMAEKVHLVRNVTYRHSSQFYVVYINNLTDQMVDRFGNGLAGYSPFVGLADLTFGCRLKYYLSTMLVNVYLQHRNLVLMGHEDDRPNEEDVNMPGYPFEQHGFTCRSFQSSIIDIFLHYKIERPVFTGDEADTELSLNAIHEKPLPLADLEIVVDPRKFEYLAREKEGSLKRADLLLGDNAALQRAIKDRISSNYIYNMTFDPTFGLSKFDIILEVNPKDSPPRRLVAALRYEADDKRLHLITLF